MMAVSLFQSEHLRDWAKLSFHVLAINIETPQIFFLPFSTLKSPTPLFIVYYCQNNNKFISGVS